MSIYKDEVKKLYRSFIFGDNVDDDGYIRDDLFFFPYLKTLVRRLNDAEKEVDFVSNKIMEIYASEFPETEFPACPHGHINWDDCPDCRH